MMPAYVLMFKWLLAGVSCALAGLAMYYLLNAALRAWPALAARRTVWLAAQIDRAINPATLLTDLDAHATMHALKVRRQQQGY